MQISMAHSIFLLTKLLFYSKAICYSLIILSPFRYKSGGGQKYISFLYLPFLSFILFHQNSFFFFLSFLTNLSYSFLFLYCFQSSFFLFFLFLGRYLILSVSPSLTFSGQLDFFIATADLLPIHSRWLDIIHLTQCFLYTQRSHITMVQGPIH